MLTTLCMTTCHCVVSVVLTTGAARKTYILCGPGPHRRRAAKQTTTIPSHVCDKGTVEFGYIEVAAST